MNLQKFRENEERQKKISIVVFSIICLLLIGGVYFYKTYALYEVKDIKNIIEGTVQEMGDLSYTYYIDDLVALSAPEKGAGQVFDEEKSYCINMDGDTTTDGTASVTWNYEKWGPLVTGLSQSKTKCFLHFKTQYSESLLNGADPVLRESLIPVNVANDGTVTKADTGSEWYNYGNKQWANAIILSDENVIYNVGDVISESNIESYFVWIPRYRYQIFDIGEYPTGDTSSKTSSTLNATQIVNIVFETKDLAASEGTQVGEWLTHPAFRAFDTNGMWVGKFETGKKSGSDNIRNGSAVQVKPNVASWRGIQVANAFYTSYDYKRELESHMMKNTEWGAVAYLTWSNYGLGLTDIRINNNSSYLTGYAAVDEPTCGYTANNATCNTYGTSSDITQAYNTTTGYMASTTGNISGVYDMSGGAWEYVMGVMLDQNGKPASGRNNTYNSNFIGTLTYPNDGSNTSKTSWTASDGGVEWPDKRYYDSYAYSTSYQQYGRRILGDATGELGGFEQVTYTGTTSSGSSSSQTRVLSSWYADQAYFVYDGSPWFRRGGYPDSGLDAGVGAFDSGYGRADSWISFRLVLAP